MDIPLELSFHNMDSSDALKDAVRRHLDKLVKFHDHIIGCRVVIEMPHKSHRLASNAPDVHIVMRVPGREIVVGREQGRTDGKKVAVDAYAVLDDAFRAMEQQLKDYHRIRHGEVKSRSAPANDLGAD